MNPASWFAVGCFAIVAAWLVVELIRAPHKANQHADRFFGDKWRRD